MPRAKQRDGVFERNDRSGWFVSYVDAAGVRRKQKVEAHTRTQALKVLEAIRTKIQTEKILGVKQASDITVSELLERFRRFQKGQVRPTTFDRLEGIVDVLKTKLPERARDITREIVEGFVNTRLEVVAPATVTKEMAVLKYALKKAVEWKLLHDNPAQGVKLPKLPEGRTRYLSPTELRATLTAAPEWMRAPIALAAFTGMRRGELLGLRWMDVDLAGRRIYLRETKNGSLRVAPVNELAFRVLASLPQGAPADPVLPGVDGPRLSVAMERLFRKLGIHDASFHSLRHTAASWLVMQGVDLYTVGQILGHKTPRMTQRYAHLSPQYLAGAAGKLDGVFESVLVPGPAPTALVPVASPAIAADAAD